MAPSSPPFPRPAVAPTSPLAHHSRLAATLEQGNGDDSSSASSTENGSAPDSLGLTATADTSTTAAVPTALDNTAAGAEAVAAGATAVRGTARTTPAGAAAAPRATSRGASTSPHGGREGLAHTAAQQQQQQQQQQATSTATAGVTRAKSASSSPSRLGRSVSLRAAKAATSSSTPLDSPGEAGGAPSRSNSRHMSHSSHSRPAPQPSGAQRDAWEASVASSNLSQSSDGLQALLRDHPELVSHSLAAAAGSGWSGMQSRGTNSGAVSGNTTPAAEEGDPNEQGTSVDAKRASVMGTPTAPPPNLGSAGAKPDYSEAKIVVAMVGLPARGKSYLSNKLMRYLRWLEYDVRVFNVGQLRRALAKTKLKESGVREDHTATFFDPNNPAAFKLRTQMAEECLEQLIGWLKRGGNVGIHDATNSSKARREAIAKRIAKEPGLKLVFLESICTDPAVIAANVAVKVSSGDPDYAGMSPEAAKADFLNRIKNYEANYESVDADGTETHLSYCKITDVGRSVVVNAFSGYLESRIAFFLMNLHLTPRNIYLSRHGESQFNVEGKIGGDADLSSRGWKYAEALPQLVKDVVGDAPLTVWHSTLKRTGQTASHLDYPKLAWKSLDELDAGVCDGMTYEEIEQYYPEDAEARDDDKFMYRYRGGESYRDVVVRLEPIIMELERQENILIIAHQAIIRCLYAYLHALAQEDLPYLKIPLHTLICLTPRAYGCDEKRFKAPIEAVDTHRARVSKPIETTKEPTSPTDSLEEAATSLPPSQRPPPQQ